MAKVDNRLQRRAKQVVLRSSGRWIILPPNSESRRQKNHEPSKSGIPKRKKIDRRPSLSCKNDYLLRSNHAEQSIASEFFTGDQVVSLCCMAAADQSAVTP